MQAAARVPAPLREKKEAIQDQCLGAQLNQEVNLLNQTDPLTPGDLPMLPEASPTHLLAPTDHAQDLLKATSLVLQAPNPMHQEALNKGLLDPEVVRGGPVQVQLVPDLAQVLLKAAQPAQNLDPTVPNLGHRVRNPDRKVQNLDLAAQNRDHRVQSPMLKVDQGQSRRVQAQRVGSLDPGLVVHPPALRVQWLDLVVKTVGQILQDL